MIHIILLSKLKTWSLKVISSLDHLQCSTLTQFHIHMNRPLLSSRPVDLTLSSKTCIHLKGHKNIMLLRIKFLVHNLCNPVLQVQCKDWRCFDQAKPYNNNDGNFMAALLQEISWTLRTGGKTIYFETDSYKSLVNPAKTERGWHQIQSVLFSGKLSVRFRSTGSTQPIACIGQWSLVLCFQNCGNKRRAFYVLLVHV